MIALDSSALVAIAMEELEAEIFKNVILDNDCIIGWPTILETRIVLLSRVGKVGIVTLNTILALKNLTPINFDEVTYNWAAFAFETYGKDRHPAGLNYGDCLAYGVAKAFDAPLLFKGKDFIHTDIKQAHS